MRPPPCISRLRGQLTVTRFLVTVDHALNRLLGRVLGLGWFGQRAVEAAARAGAAAAAAAHARFNGSERLVGRVVAVLCVDIVELRVNATAVRLAVGLA